MYELLILINKMGYLILLGNLLVVIFFLKKYEGFAWFVKAISVLATFQMAYELILLELKQAPDYLDAVILCWYSGFAFSNLIFVYTVFGRHSSGKLHLNLSERLIVFNYICLSLVQVIRGAERIVLELSYTSVFYSHAIPILNVSNLFIITLTVTLLSWDKYLRNFVKRFKC